MMISEYQNRTLESISGATPTRYVITIVVRLFSLGTVGLVILFLLNNYLIYWQEWPGLSNFFAHNEWLSLEPLRSPLTELAVVQGWIQLSGLIVLLALVAGFVLLTPRRTLRVESKTLSRFAGYVIRACFWGVLLVGLADMVISFLRVEGWLEPLFGDKMAKNLGRPSWRGTFVHYPLILVGFIIALFSRNLGFMWLTLLVVFSEFLIVVTRFIYSYEQVFQGDLVRFWYAALFLFASAYALTTEGHVRVDVFYSQFTRRGKAWTNGVGSLLLGLPLCWAILTTGMSGRGSSLNSPLLSFEVYQQGYGMYVKYLMVGFLVVFAVSMMIQFCSYLLSSVADLCKEPDIDNLQEQREAS